MLSRILQILAIIALFGVILTQDVLAQDYRRRRRNEDNNENTTPPNNTTDTPTETKPAPPKPVAQTGTLRGSLIDALEATPLIGATVMIPALKRGANTDIDGQFNLYELPPGEYLVKFMSLNTLPDSTMVTIEPGKVTVVDIQMRPDLKEIDAVEISARKMVNNEAIMLVEQMRSPIVLNGISREEFRRNGDRTAAAAISRVVGVTVEGGRYLYVRGLGDRYSKVMLQGTEMPSLDPERNAVQTDLFPTAIIENMVVYKTQSPDLPGNFSGGLLDIRVRDFPDRFQLSVSSSMGLNTQAFNADNYLTYNESSAIARLGGDDPEMARPDAYSDPEQPFPDYTGSDAERAELDQITKQWGTDMTPNVDQALRLNHSHAITMGGQTRLFGRPLGLNGSFTYRRNFNHYDEGIRGNWKLTGSVDNNETLSRQFELAEISSSENAKIGGLAVVSYKPTDNTKLRMFYMHNRSGDVYAQDQVGFFPEDGLNIVRRNNIAGYQGRAIQTGYLSLEQVFPAANNLKMDLMASVSGAKQFEPDLRFYSDNAILNTSGDTVNYTIDESQYFPPSRYYRNMDERNYDARLNVGYPFEIGDRTGLVKAGGAFTYKDREFGENRYQYVLNPSFMADYNGQPSYVFNDSTLGYEDVNENGTFDSGEERVSIEDQTLQQNNYTATQAIAAAYAMVDLPITRRFRALVGVRMETTNIAVENISLGANEGEVNEVDLLPSANLIYSLNERMNLRASYGRSIARPTFRELAPFLSFNFLGDFQLLGNEGLERTIIDNAELRWEWFPNVGEIISAGVFFKNFNNPIERAITLAQNPQIQFQNVPNAKVYGVEVEVRKKLSFITEAMKDFVVGLNVTYLNSQVDIPESELQIIRTQNPEADKTRRMFMQSDYIVNARVGYNNVNIGTDVNLVFNVFGERLATVSRGATPNIFEQPRPSLDFVITQNFSFLQGENADRWSVSFRATNLLNPEYRMHHDYKGEEYVFRSYTIGRTFTLGVNYTL